MREVDNVLDVIAITMLVAHLQEYGAVFEEIGTVAHLESFSLLGSLAAAANETVNSTAVEHRSPHAYRAIDNRRPRLTVLISIFEPEKIHFDNPIEPHQTCSATRIKNVGVAGIAASAAAVGAVSAKTTLKRTGSTLKAQFGKASNVPGLARRAFMLGTTVML